MALTRIMRLPLGAHNRVTLAFGTQSLQYDSRLCRLWACVVTHLTLYLPSPSPRMRIVSTNNISVLQDAESMSTTACLGTL